MRKKQFLQFRRAMATLLAVAMIGQNTVMTTAENYVADNTAVVAEEQAQEPEVQVEESASPAVQESAPAAETPAEPAAQAVAETPAEPNIINLRKKWKGICSQVPFIVLKYRQGCI